MHRSQRVSHRAVLSDDLQTSKTEGTGQLPHLSCFCNSSSCIFCSCTSSIAFLSLQQGASIQNRPDDRSASGSTRANYATASLVIVLAALHPHLPPVQVLPARHPRPPPELQYGQRPLNVLVLHHPALPKTLLNFELWRRAVLILPRARVTGISDMASGRAKLLAATAATSQGDSAKKYDTAARLYSC